MHSAIISGRSEHSRASWKRVFRAYSSFFRCDSSSVSRPDPIVSISSSTNIGQARERERGGEEWREDRRGKSNMVDGKLLSNKIPRIYGERSGNDLPGRQNSLSTSGKSITSLSSPPRPVSSLFPLRIDWHRGLSHK